LLLRRVRTAPDRRRPPIPKKLIGLFAVRFAENFGQNDINARAICVDLRADVLLERNQSSSQPVCLHFQERRPRNLLPGNCTSRTVPRRTALHGQRALRRRHDRSQGRYFPNKNQILMRYDTNTDCPAGSPRCFELKQHLTRQPTKTRTNFKSQSSRFRMKCTPSN